uniref:Uncharacterized protein n=1 Tax=Leersia perrieri TaxID=77586 RepID=A0A0D9WKL9_9ORYZ
MRSPATGRPLCPVSIAFNATESSVEEEGEFFFDPYNQPALRSTSSGKEKIDKTPRRLQHLPYQIHS